MRIRDCVLDLERSIDLVPEAATWLDQSRYKNNGTITGATWVQLPNKLWVLSFNGIANNVLVATSFNNCLAKNDFSLSFWFRHAIAYSAEETLVYKGTGADTEAGFWCYRSATNSLWLNFNDDQGLNRLQKTITTGVTLLNNWHLFTGSFDRDGLATFFIDAVSITTLDISSRPQSIGVYQMLFGLTLAGTLPLNGLFGSPRIFTYALTAGQIANIFNSEKALYGVV